MNGMSGGWMWAVGTTGSLTFEFPPQFVLAYTSLSKSGGEIAHSWIFRYRRRLPSGADETIELPGDPTIFADNNVTSVTFGVMGLDGIAWATPIVTFW